MNDRKLHARIIAGLLRARLAGTVHDKPSMLSQGNVVNGPGAGL